MNSLDTLARPIANRSEARGQDLVSPREIQLRKIMPDIWHGLQLEARAFQEQATLPKRSEIEAGILGLPEEGFEVFVGKYTAINAVAAAYGDASAKRILREFAATDYSLRKSKRYAKYRLFSDTAENISNRMIQIANVNLQKITGPYHHDGGHIEHCAYAVVKFDRAIAQRRDPDAPFITAMALYEQKQEDYSKLTNAQFDVAKDNWNKWQQNRTRRNVMHVYEKIVRTQGALTAHALQNRWHEVRRAYDMLKRPVSPQRRDAFLAVVEAMVRGTEFNRAKIKRNKLTDFSGNIFMLSKVPNLYLQKLIVEFFFAQATFELNHSINFEEIDRSADLLAKKQNSQASSLKYE